MTPRLATTIGALSAAIAVTLGAFGAHALKDRLDARDLATFETAVRYQMYHAFALIAAAWVISRGGSGAGNAAWAFVAGSVVFCGSLYLLVGTGQRWLGAVTPLGGVAFILGWLLLAQAAWKLEM
ncbi:MAG: DUF423 domain-containing protein [Gemmatimonadales bacterium]